MKIALNIIAALSILAVLFVLSQSATVFHEQLAALLVVSATVAIAGLGIIRAIETLTPRR